MSRSSPVNVRFDDELAKKIAFVCNHQDMTKSGLIRQSVREFVDAEIVKIKLKSIFIEENAG